MKAVWVHALRQYRYQCSAYNPGIVQVDLSQIFSSNFFYSFSLCCVLRSLPPLSKSLFIIIVIVFMFPRLYYQH